jgi:hypothetical protein
VNSTLPTLYLALKSIYFDAIDDGTKTEEYRLDTEYWCKRLVGREYARIVLTKGYPRRSDMSRRLIRPWRGYTMQTIKHEHFGPDSVIVFAIRVEK